VEVATWESNGHVTDDVTTHVTPKGQGRDPICLMPIISKTARDRGFVPKDREQVVNGLWRVECSRAR